MAYIDPQPVEGSLSKFKVIDPKTIFCIKQCLLHPVKLMQSSHGILPFELLWYLYTFFIHDISTCVAFQKAFHWEHLNCQRLFCQQYICELWKQNRLDTVTMAEIEYTKIFHYQQQHILYHPSIYHIQRVSDGFTMINYKYIQSPYQLSFHRRRRNHFDSYTAYNLIHIYDPHIARQNLQMTQPIPKQLLQLYYPIKVFFKREQPYIRSVVVDQETPSAVKTKHYGRPCLEWVQILYDMYMFQKKHSLILKGLKQKVSFSNY